MSTGKYSDENEQEKGRNNIKGAADLLLKGGTLLSTSCVKCGGVQVRYKEETVCVSCGRKIKDANNGTQQIEVEDSNIEINNLFKIQIYQMYQKFQPYLTLVYPKQQIQKSS